MKKILSIIIALAIVTTVAPPPPLLTLNTFSAEIPTVTLSGTGQLTQVIVQAALEVYGGYKDVKAAIVIDGYTSINPFAFRDCRALTSITISNSVTSIGEYAFENCVGLTSITIPRSVLSIGSAAFSRCTGLTEIIISDSVLNIGSSAFNGCDALTSVIIPDSVLSVGYNAFSECEQLTYVKMSNSITIIEAAIFQLCRALEMVVLPESVTTIGSGAFGACGALTEIILPNTITTIKDNAFGYSRAIPSIIIPKSVISIEAYAFDGWTSAQTIYMEHTDASQLTWTNPPTAPNIVWGYTPPTHSQSSETPLTLKLRKTVLDITQPTQISVVIDPNEAGLEIISDDYYIQSNNNCKVNVEMIAFDLSDRDESGYSVVPPNSEPWATLPATQKKLALGLQHANTSELSNGVLLTNGTVWSTDLSTPIEVCSISANKRATFNIIAQHGYSVKEPTTIKLEIIPRIYAA